jgi:hypothetical protein
MPCNISGKQILAYLSLFGSLALLPPPPRSAKYFAYKIEFGRRIRSKGEDGQIVEDVIFVTDKNRPPTFFSRVASLFLCG